MEIRQLVEEVMQRDNKAKNSDMWLYIRLWQSLGFKIYIPYEDIKDLPKPETISRARRYIQNTENKHLPTDPEIKEKRGIKEENFRQYYK